MHEPVRRVEAALVRPLRHRVLRAGLPAESAVFDGDDDPRTGHFAAFDAGRVVGCASVCPTPRDGRPAWRLRGMAVDPTLHGGGVGRRLLAAVHAYVDAAGGQAELWCNARVPAVAFYERCGWAAVSGVYDIPTAGPHRTMVRL